MNYKFLHTLDLSFNRVEGAAGGRAIAKLIGRRPERSGGIALTKLDLSHNQLGSEGLAPILEQLARPEERIESLNLDYNDITLVLGSQFESSHYTTALIGIENFVLDGNPFKRGGYTRLAVLMRMLVPLSALSMRDCLVDD